MGPCMSKTKKKNKEQPERKDGDNKRDKDQFDDIENEKNNRKKPNINAKKKSSKGSLSSDDSDSSSDSSRSDRPAKISSSKKIKRTKNGGVMVVSNKTIIGGDNIVIGEGSKIVNVTIGGDRKSRRDREDKPTRRTSGQKPDFSVLKILKPTTLQRLPGCFMQMENRNVYAVDQEVLTQVARSVGKIHAAGTYCATVFRVGSTYIMTAKHVLDGILDNEYKCFAEYRDVRPDASNVYAALKYKSVYVDFEYLKPGHRTCDSTKFYLTSNVPFVDDDLDVAVIELERNPDCGFPPEFIKFSQALPHKMFTFIGHPNGEAKQFNPVDGPLHLPEEILLSAVTWSATLGQPDGFAGIDNMNRLLFHCSFEKGASGSPGIAVIDGSEAVVVTMLVRGYPDWYYDNRINPDFKASVGKNQRIEQGVNMLSLYEKMHTVNLDLCVAIFGQPS